MNTGELENIWSQQGDYGHPKNVLSLDEIKEATLAFSSEHISSGQRTIIFDLAYKGLVLTGYLILISIGILTPVKLVVTLLIVASLSYLIFRNFVLNRGFISINDANPVIDVLEKRYDVLNQYYREFLFNTSITNPLFVFAGFQFYDLFRYGEDRFYELVNDPVIYLFLLLAFLIPYAAQSITYSRLIKEMEQILNLDIDEVEQEVTLIKLYAKRRARRVIFATAALLGSVILLILIINLL